MGQDDPFTEDVVQQIMRHMNQDHAEDCATICRALGAHPGARAARVSGLDATGIDFLATVDGMDVRVRLPWSERLTERPQVRREVVRMTVEAREALGMPAHDAH